MILANGCNITKSEKFKGVWILSVPTVYVCICVYKCVCVCVCIYIYIYIYICVYIYMYAQIILRQTASQ